MPKKNGFEALREIRATPALKKIPVIMLTVSNNKSDVIMSYNLGANSFVTKPYEFNQLVDSLRVVQQYWFGTVELPKA
jgi:DNA-binding response OmpR family regulator